MWGKLYHGCIRNVDATILAPTVAGTSQVPKIKGDLSQNMMASMLNGVALIQNMMASIPKQRVCLLCSSRFAAGLGQGGAWLPCPPPLDWHLCLAWRGHVIECHYVYTCISFLKHTYIYVYVCVSVQYMCIYIYVYLIVCLFVCSFTLELRMLGGKTWARAAGSLQELDQLLKTTGMSSGGSWPKLLFPEWGACIIIWII